MAADSDTPGRQAKPNIILICADQHRADTIGCYGSAICQTPELDRLASQGVRFDWCFANNPVCAPSRATIMTGLQSMNHGLVRNGYQLSRQLPTLASTLQSHGYNTHAIGKLHLSPQEQGVDRAPYYGFNTLEPSEDPKIGPYLEWAIANFPEHANYLIGTLFNLPTNERYWQGRRDYRQIYLQYRERYVLPHEISSTCNWGHGHFSPLPPEAHQTTWITNRAIAALESHPKNQPLLLWVGYQDPHDPYDPPAPYRDMYNPRDLPSPVGRRADSSLLPENLHGFQESFSTFTDRDWRTLKALYYGSVTFMDAAIGRLVRAAENALDMRNTIIIYLADHGEFLGDHGVKGKWVYHYDSGNRVPLIWRQDGRWQGGSQRAEIVELCDLMPTLLAAADVSAAAPLDGVSYLPLLDGAPTPQWRDHAYIESCNYQEATNGRDAALFWPRTIRTVQYRCTFHNDPDCGELYDLRADPHEDRNLFNDPAARHIVEEHRQRLAARGINFKAPPHPRPYNV